jgi:hypothetical protein
MTLEAALAATATLVAVAFGCSTLERWLDRRRRHELAWTISLGLFAVASATLWLGAARGWDAPTFRAFYLFGAILNVPWLAMGSVYLFWGPRRGDPIAVGLGVLSGFAAGVMVTSPLTAPVPAHGLPQGSDVFGALPRILAGVCSGVAALVVFALAILSAWRLVRGRARSRTALAPVHAGRLALGNLLIAAGTLVLAGSGTLNARLGALTAFGITLVIGIVLLFCGFLVVTTAPATSSAVVHPTPSAMAPATSSAP